MPKSTQTSFPSFMDAMLKLGKPAHPEQLSVVERFQYTSDNGHIGFIEAPTATGKTLAIAYHALCQATASGETFVVAVPTIELAHQTAQAIADMQAALNSHIPVGVLVGRHEFLSEPALLDLSEKLHEKAAAEIKKWISAGAPGRSPAHSSWTRDGLSMHLHQHDLFPNLTNPALSLGPSDKDSAAYAAYQDQFEQPRDILIATHAMLARDLVMRFIETSKKRRQENMPVDPRLTPVERWLVINQQRLEVETGDEGRLPDYREIIVDEAHLLRETFENALRTGISVSMLLKHVAACSRSSKGIVPAAALKEIKAIKDRFTALAAKATGDRMLLSWNQESEYHRLLARLEGALDKIQTKNATIDLEHDVTAITRAKYAIRESLRARDSVNTVIEWSPVRTYPTLSIGRRSLNSEFNLLWERLKSAALISASLYTDNVSGPSIGYVAGRLAIPDHRRKTFEPIPASWIKNPVTVQLPSPTYADFLEPDDQDERIARIAARIAQIETQSGILVLSTSRADTQAISSVLNGLVDPGRVIDGSKENLTYNKAIYTAKVQAGLRPIWCAQGPAWTGLDLGDDLLDSLVITRLPFPVPDAVAEGQRMQYGPAKIAQMTMTFKQGVGRLVRSRAATRKQLSILDGRIQRLDSAKGALNLMRSYTHQEISIPG